MILRRPNDTLNKIMGWWEKCNKSRWAGGRVGRERGEAVGGRGEGRGGSQWGAGRVGGVGIILEHLINLNYLFNYLYVNNATNQI